MTAERPQPDEEAHGAEARGGGHRVPWLLIGIYVIVLVVAGCTLFWIEAAFPFPPRSPVAWGLVVILLLPIYFIAEAIGEGASEELLQDSRPLMKLLPIALLVLFYVLWFAWQW